MNKIQIVVISPSKFPGKTGDTSNYSEMINQLTKEGFEVFLICPKNPDSVDGNLGFSTDVKIIRIPYQPPNHKYEIKNGFKPKHYWRLLLFLVIESVVVFSTLKHKRIRYVLTRHGIFTVQLPIIFRLLGTRTIADGDLISNSFEDQINPMILGLIKHYEKKVIKWYTRFKVSTISHAECLQKIGLPKERILISPVGVDIERIPKFSIEEIPEHTFGYFGVLEKWQGVDILLKAFELLRKKIPTAKLYVIGKGSLEESLKESVMDNNLSSDVTFTSVPREKLLHEYFKKFRIVVIPRPRQNNSTDTIFPIKLAECLAAGKPTIVMDIPVMREVQKNSVFIVPSEDPESLAKAMETLSMNKEMMEKYSRMATSAANNYDIRSKTKQLVNALVDDS